MYLPYTDDDLTKIRERTQAAGFDPTEADVRGTLEAKHIADNRARNEKHQAASDARVPDIRTTGIRDTFRGPDGSRMRNWQFPDRPMTDSGAQFAAATFPPPPGGGGAAQGYVVDPNQAGGAAQLGASAAREAIGGGGAGAGRRSAANLPLAEKLRDGGVVLPRANVGGTNMPVTPGYLGANYTGAGISPAALHEQNLAKAAATNSRGPIAGRRMSREERMAQDANRTQRDIAQMGNQKPVNTERGVYDPATGKFHSEPVVGFGSGHGAIREGSGYQPYGPEKEGSDYRNDFSGKDNPQAIITLFDDAGIDTTGFYQTFTDANGEYQGLSQDGNTFVQFYDMLRSFPGNENKTPDQVAKIVAERFPELARAPADKKSKETPKETNERWLRRA
ncbi:MAG: hypothetical protein EOM12_13510 [Verrucomicrobiae bacterium]|nr:hypothetical protein [Verrucomicrobiae bacterium]